jgi:uncharacterized protein YkwD
MIPRFMTHSANALGCTAVIAFALSACGVQPDVNVSSPVEAEFEAKADDVFVALGTVVDPANADGYQLLAQSSMALTSLQFCLGTQAECAATPAPRTVAAAAVTVRGMQVFVSQEFVALAHDRTITVVARDAAGTPVTRAVRIGVVGQQLPPIATDECYKAPDAFVCSVEREIVRLTNEKRASSGRGALAFDKKLGFVARLWSTEQARMGSISHAWFSNGRLAQEYKKEFGEDAGLRAENVAMNGGGDTPEAVAAAFIDQWWNSSGHKANMLGGYARLGVGVARRGSSWYGTQDFGN